ncbi:hypothetical protein AB0M29_02400 [Streptomyces sp. NPDC051976]|uniref:hypothetical protein n=1 Tax=Streptomyces sp. NPDC051976 TaxID=3154947 RepID=UPI003443CF9A
MTTLTVSAAPTATTTTEESPAAVPSMPSIHRRALLTWLAVYPAITLTFLLLGPYTAHLPLALRTLAMTAVVVPAAVYVLIPALLKADHKATTALNTRHKNAA